MSLQARNPVVLHNGDVYARMMLFFAMFLPLGDQFSLDRIRAGHSLPHHAVRPRGPDAFRAPRPLSLRC